MINRRMGLTTINRLWKTLAGPWAGFGAGYQEFRNNKSEAIKGEGLQQMGQLAEKDAQGNPFFGGGSAGEIGGSGGPS